MFRDESSSITEYGFTEDEKSEKRSKKDPDLYLVPHSETWTFLGYEYFIKLPRFDKNVLFSTCTFIHDMYLSSTWRWMSTTGEYEM